MGVLFVQEIHVLPVTKIMGGIIVEILAVPKMQTSSLTAVATAKLVKSLWQVV